MLKYLFAKNQNPNGLDVPPNATSFTYHQETGIKALLFAFLLAAIVEATVLHVLLALWNHWVALIATLSTVWVAFQVIAQIRAVGMRPIYVLDDRLVLRNGAFDLAEIKLEQVANIERSSKEPEESELQPLRVSFPASHNVALRLKEPMEAKILNRNSREFQVALLAMDKADDFVGLIQTKLKK